MESSKVRLLSLCGFVLLMGAAGVAVGDWDPGDGHKMHFPQVPDPCGWDICVRHQHVADDWVCDETGPVTDIHFWTSWKGDTIGLIMGWDIYIFDHDPQTGQPNTSVWDLGMGISHNYLERPAGSGEQGWFCPSEGIPYPDDHTEFYQINITDIEVPFIQEEGHRYWLVIGSPLTDRPIGWKTSQDHFGMTALWTLDPGKIPVDDAVSAMSQGKGSISVSPGLPYRDARFTGPFCQQTSPLPYPMHRRA